MELVYNLEIPSAGFNLYYLGYPSGTTSKSASCSIPSHEGLVGLTWHYGTEKQADFSYHNGNTEPQGFGHICISVDDLDSACARFDEQGVRWKKRLTEGRMKNVAFILDPDGYWVEVSLNDAERSGNFIANAGKTIQVIQNEKLKKSNDW